MLRIALLSLAFVSQLFVLGCTGKQLPASQIEDPGQRLFNGHVRESVACYGCHNGDARGYSVRGPDLAERVPDLTDEEILETIWTGPLLMPSYQDILSLEEARSIVAWLRKSFPSEGEAGKDGAGKDGADQDGAGKHGAGHDGAGKDGS